MLKFTLLNQGKKRLSFMHIHLNQNKHPFPDFLFQTLFQLFFSSWKPCFRTPLWSKGDNLCRRCPKKKSKRVTLCIYTKPIVFWIFFWDFPPLQFEHALYVYKACKHVHDVLTFSFYMFHLQTITSTSTTTRFHCFLFSSFSLWHLRTTKSLIAKSFRFQTMHMSFFTKTLKT